MADIKLKTCPGFGETEGKCKNPAGSKLTPIWCESCDKARGKYISTKLKTMIGTFKG